MTPNPAQVAKTVLTDTCAVWNTLSSDLLYRACTNAGFSFAITSFIAYECLHKRRTRHTAADDELVRRLHAARSAHQFQVVSLTVDDLQDVARLELRKKVSKGELSAIAFSHRTRVPFQTDDQGARKLAAEVLSKTQVQTTPHVVGWLFFHRHLADHDLATLINQHRAMGRPLAQYMQEMYEEALRCRLLSVSSQ